MAKYINPAKVVTGVCRFSYANLWEAKAMDENSKPKYSVSLIIPKSDTKTIEKIRAAIQAAYEEGQGKLKGNSKSVPALTSLKTPLRDGDLERPDDEAYANSYFVNANSITAPGIVDAACQQILDHSEIYSGVYGRASITFYAFATKHFSGTNTRDFACIRLKQAKMHAVRRVHHAFPGAAPVSRMEGAEGETL